MLKRLDLAQIKYEYIYKCIYMNNKKYIVNKEIINYFNFWWLIEYILYIYTVA